MAVTAATKTSDFDAKLLPPHISEAIFERAAQQSVFQSLIPRVPLSYNGEAIPVVTGRPVAGWVSEGGQKPATKGTMTLKTISPKKLAAIAVVASEVVRADPGGYATNLQPQLAEAFAIAFDYAVAHNLGGDGTGSGPFSTYLDQATKTSEIGTTSVANGGVYADFNAALTKIVSTKDASNRRYRMTGVAIDSVLEPVIRGAVDTTGRPVFVDLARDVTSGAIAAAGTILGRPSFMGEGVATPDLDTVVGYAGDFSQAAWGAVGSISYAISTEATVTINGSLVSLWENNLVAIRAEAEYGFLLNDANAIVKLINTNNSPVTSS
jgi:HK97 family phage major capsid protein